MPIVRTPQTGTGRAKLNSRRGKTNSQEPNKRKVSCRNKVETWRPLVDIKETSPTLSFLYYLFGVYRCAI